MSVTSYIAPAYEEAPRPLTDEEKRLLKRLFSDYFEVPQEWKAELKADLERDPPILGQATLGVGIGAASALPLEKLASSGYIGSSGIYLAPGAIAFNYPTGPSIRAAGGYLDLWTDTIRFGASLQDIRITRPAGNQIGFAVDYLVFGSNLDVVIHRGGTEQINMDYDRLALNKPVGAGETPLVLNGYSVYTGPNGSAGGIGRALYVANA